jgi:hypothetical protein
MSVLADLEVKKYSVEKFRLEARIQLRKWKLGAPEYESARMSSTELIGDHVLDGLPVSQSRIWMRETQSRFAPITTPLASCPASYIILQYTHNACHLNECNITSKLNHNIPFSLLLHSIIY